MSCTGMIVVRIVNIKIKGLKKWKKLFDGMAFFQKYFWRLGKIEPLKKQRKKGEVSKYLSHLGLFFILHF